MFCATATELSVQECEGLICIFNFSVFIKIYQLWTWSSRSHVLNTNAITLIKSRTASRCNSEALKNKRPQNSDQNKQKTNGMYINWWLELWYSHCANCSHRQAVWPQSSTCYKIVMYQLTGFISKLHWLSCHHCQVLHIKRTFINTMSVSVGLNKSG
jgi:hypothetical protein